MSSRRHLWPCFAAILLSLALSVRGQNSAITAYPAGPKAVYAGGVKIASGTPLYFTSGLTAGKDGGETMKAQALTTLAKLKANIATAGFSLSDVVFARAYLAPGVDGAIDYAGWDAAWTETFGTATLPHKPARTTIGVPALGGPTTLIEIEYVCAAPASDKLFPSAATTLASANPNLKVYGTKEARIAAGVGIVGGAAMYWSAGTTPGKDGGADTKTQALTILKKLKTNLDAAGLSFSDIVFLRALLAPDKAKGGKADSEGWNEAYNQFFNTPENPHKPARASIPVASFGGDMLIEIEVIAAYPGKPKPFEGATERAVALKAFGASDAMIASGIAVAEKDAFYFSSGALSTEDGDLKTQALAAFETLNRRLSEAGLSFKDVVFLRAYVAPEADGTFDRKGWGEAYNQYFNNPQNPHKPARTTISIKSLPRVGAKIELDVIAASSK